MSFLFLEIKLSYMKTVEEFMNKDVISLSPDDTIFDAAKLLAQLKIAGAPVVKDDKVVGIVSLSDIVKFINIKLGKLPIIDSPGFTSLILALAQMQKLQLDFKKELNKITSSKVEEVMTKDVTTISPTSTLLEAAELMEKHDVNRLPVVSEGKLVGIVTRADLVSALIY